MRPLTLLLDVHFGGAVLRAARFGLVGASGLVVNQLLLAAFTELGSVHYVVAAVFATQGSTTWNFALSNSWVFNDRSPRRSALVRLAQCLVVNNAMLLGRGPLLVAMTEGLGIHYLVSNVVTLVMFTLIRYVLADRWIWVRTGSTLCAAYDYDVHGIIRIASDACLPELAYFQTSHPIERPDVRVHVGRPAAPAVGAPEPAGPNHRLLRYQEVLRQFGFWVEIAYGESVEVTVSPLLRYSGHVLYTNVVEPLLRWMLVQRGYALMHGACIKLANGALLITARTDTGKTSTILHLLAQHNLGFLSDDMVILRPDGRALCYPKPLTISRHTLSAVNRAAELSRRERLGLQLQSRVHSRSGRGIAFALMRLPLPVATINTVVQMIVPPPKYAITRLVPGVALEREATIRQRVEIARGPDAELSLAAAAAQTIALEDCDDAYGFPPYRDLEPFLTTWDGQNLAEVERRIIGEALGACPTTLISRQQRNWWARIAELYLRNGDADADGGASGEQADVRAEVAPAVGSHSGEA